VYSFRKGIIIAGENKTASMLNQNPEQIARDHIDRQLIACGWTIQRRELTYKMIKDLVETIKMAKPQLAPLRVWRAFEQLEKSNGQPKNELIALVSLVRRVAGLDATLTIYDATVDKNFQDWAFRKQAGPLKFTEEQMIWLRMIKDYVAASFHIDREDFDLSPFNAKGGLGKMWQLFGGETEGIIGELNEVLAA